MLDKTKRFLNDKNERALSLVAFIWFGLFVITLLRLVEDTDLYYFIPNGEYILKHGIPYINPFISTPNVPITIQNWLYCVICALANRLGKKGLFTLHAMFVFSTLALVFYFLKGVKSKVFKALYFIVFAYSFRFWTIRPQMLTFILCMATVIGVEKYNETGKVLWLSLIPLANLIEINTHASYWIMHYIVLLPYFVPFFSNIVINKNIKDKKKVLNILLFSLIGLAVLFINPYGIKSITYVFNALGNSTFDICSNIVEQQSGELFSFFSFTIITLIITFTVALCYKKIDSVTFWMFIGCTILVIYKLKFFPFFGFGVLYLLRTLNDVPRIKIKNGLALLIIVFTITLSNLSIKPVELCDSYLKLEKMADYLDEHEDFNTSVMVYFQYENYFEYRGYKVYLDARPELYPEEILKTANAFYGTDGNTSSQRKEIHDKLDIDYVITYTDSQICEELNNNENYTFIMENDVFAMFKKGD